ncbi:hypothetical protein FRC09_017176 [Ceratobasidium sp. 395]|nr:hypothetical protein FRC09_017176 [Ceratobasidium sp. 395]
MGRATNTSAALVPVNALPLEILSQIFTFSASPLNCDNWCHEVSRQHPLAVIPAVCAQWRELAISTRSLWSHIYVNGSVSHEESNPNAHQWTKLLLDCSRGAPLSLHFRGGSQERRPDIERVAAFLQPYISNVTSLVFDMLIGQVVHAILELYSSHPPVVSLTALSLAYIKRPTTRVEFTWPVDALCGLRTLVLWRLPDTLYPDVDVLAQILLNNPHLHTIRIDHIRTSAPGRNTPARATLPYLKHLELASESSAVLGQQLSILEPSANELNVVLIFSHSLDPKCSQEVWAFFERANVTGLNICSSKPDYAAQMFTCLDGVPCLRELSLSCMGRFNGSAFLSAFLVTSDHREALARFPDLRYLTISETSIDQVELQQIVDIYQLSSIVLHCNLIFQGGPRGSLSDKEFLNWLRQRVDTVVSVGIDDEQDS